MADAQRVVEGIRNFLHSGHQTALEALKSMAQEYGDACQEVNRRLARCEEFLRQGLRSEAIHFAQAEPVLLDVLSVLDFPERADWDQVVMQYSLPAPPAFRIDTATALNQAYAQAAPLDDLLKRHRLLALARAPLADRLAVLRQIAQLDPGNPIWTQDVLVFEQARLQQILAEVDQFRRRHDMPPLHQIEALFRELQGVPWRTPVPAELLGAITTMYHTLCNRQAQQRLEQFVHDLEAAQRNQNDALVRALAQQWQQLTQQVVLAPNDPLVGRANAVVAWLAKRDRQGTPGSPTISRPSRSCSGRREAIGGRPTRTSMNSTGSGPQQTRCTGRAWTASIIEKCVSGGRPASAREEHIILGTIFLLMVAAGGGRAAGGVLAALRIETRTMVCEHG